MAVTRDTSAPSRRGSDAVAPAAHLDGVQAPVISYDRDSDILMAQIQGRRPHVVSYATDELAFLVDSDSDEVLGFQIDDVLAVVAPRHPLVYDVLMASELHGISADEVARLRRRALGTWGQLRATFARWRFLRTHRADPPMLGVIEDLVRPHAGSLARPYRFA